MIKTIYQWFTDHFSWSQLVTLFNDHVSGPLIFTMIIGVLIGRFWVSATTRYYLKMSEAIIRANNNLKKDRNEMKKDRDKWRDLAERTDRLNEELRKQLTKSIAEKKAAEKIAEQARFDFQAQKKRIEELVKHNLDLTIALLKAGVIAPRPEWQDFIDKNKE